MGGGGRGGGQRYHTAGRQTYSTASTQGIRLVSLFSLCVSWLPQGGPSCLHPRYPTAGRQTYRTASGGDKTGCRCSHSVCRGFADLAVLVDSGAGDTYHWLAATDTAEEGQWVWQDGTPVTYATWKSREFPPSLDQVPLHEQAFCLFVVRAVAVVVCPVLLTWFTSHCSL